MRVELRNIHKHYGTVSANNGISLKVLSGTIHGILGENGAGKSTLMKILAGFTSKTKGEILFEGATADYETPAQASRLGIGMLYQDPLDFPKLTVLENFMLGQSTGLINQNAIYKRKLTRLCKHLNFDLSADRPADSLTIGERQQLEILRLLSIGARVLILDEPTTGISGLQKEILFRALRKITVDGKSIILVSHKLSDVETLCDRVTVLRQGTVTGEMEKPFDTRALLTMMFGSLPAPPARMAVPPGKEVLVLKQVRASGGRAGLTESNVTIRQGEVVGLAGLEGSGQGLFLRVACGLKTPLTGSIHFQGQKVDRKKYHFFKQAGVAYLPSSRLEEGLVSGLTLTEHFAIQLPGTPFIVPWRQARKTARNQIRKFHIKGMPQAAVESLSGGNQQRLLLSFLPENPVLLLLENPTRGLDMESAHWVWQYLKAYCAHSTSIVFSSPEIDEILMVADRVLVFFNGRIIKDAKTGDIDIHELGRAIAGKT